MRRLTWLIGLLSVCLLFVVTSTAFAGEVQSEEVVARTKSATLEAQIDPQSHDTTCAAQYVSEEQFKRTGWTGVEGLPCSPADLGSGSSAVEASVALPNLEISTTYRYRFLLTSEGTTVPGPEETFATFGIETFDFEALTPPTSFGIDNEPLGQEQIAQAGAHPFELKTYIAANTTPYEGHAGYSPDAIIKDAIAQLPPGLIGNPTALSRCSARAAEEERCRVESEVGTITVFHGLRYESSPLFNVVAPEGVVARFAGEINLSTDAYIDASVRTGTDYGVTAAGYNITALANLHAFKITLWGTPQSPAHNPERYCPAKNGGGYEQLYESSKGKEACPPEGPERPFLTLPSNCHQPQQATAELTSYAEPEENPVTKTIAMPMLTGCATEPFEPSIETTPTTHAADSPTGLNVALRVKQNENPTGQAAADLKDATVTFPAGLVVDPSSADGLQACSEKQVGYKHEFAELNPSAEPGVKTAQFTPGKTECPQASKLAEVEVKTPLIGHVLKGGLYLAKQRENPFESLLAVYLAVYDEVTGVVIKLPGRVVACHGAGEQEGVQCAAAGQLVTVFEQNPQLPFEELRVDFPEGKPGQSRASLTTPFTCGSYSTSTVLVPWSSPEGKTEEPLSPAFSIGENCSNQESEASNSPSFEAGTASPIAGSYSPFVLHLSREDGSQRFGSLNVTLPPGLSGKVAGIEECPQAAIEAAQARHNEGEGFLEQSHPSCPSGSEVGVVHVGAGSGAPYYVSGRAYWAGPYEGAPFSLVIVTPALAGPFDLGTVVVRAALFINPVTAQVTAKSDPFPTILDGIPLDIRDVTVEINRPEFIINPTSCAVMTATGELQSTAGRTASLSDRFQAGGCTSLPFHPSFAVSTSAHTSKADGASLRTTLAFPPGPQGSEANAHLVKVELPVQLPSRLTTLQKACTAAQFETNPAGCPAASVVGHAKAITPILPVPLEGPAYFVSHGGEAFPNLTIVLQGDGVTVQLVGDTFISKSGITSSTFKTVPDVPVSNFELTLPQGPYSALTANGSLCAQPLVMPTEMVGQNGAVIHQQTQIAVEGCAPELKIVSHKAHDGIVTLRVEVPAAGTLTATGKGFTTTAKRATKPATIVLKLRLTPHERKTLARLRGRKLRSTIALTFTPTHRTSGTSKLTGKVTVLVR